MKTTINTVIKSCLLAALLATTNAWTVIHAQESSAVLEEIIVTAQKRQENLQTLGISVSAFDGDALNALGARDIVELFKVCAQLANWYRIFGPQGHDTRRGQRQPGSF